MCAVEMLVIWCLISDIILTEIQYCAALSLKVFNEQEFRCTEIITGHHVQ